MSVYDNHKADSTNEVSCTYVIVLAPPRSAESSFLMVEGRLICNGDQKKSL